MRPISTIVNYDLRVAVTRKLSVFELRVVIYDRGAFGTFATVIFRHGILAY